VITLSTGEGTDLTLVASPQIGTSRGGNVIRHLKYAAATVVALLLLASVAVAQNGDYGGSRNTAGQSDYGGSRKAREHGFQHGYRDGYRQGRADLKANVKYNPESQDFRNADLGYEEYMGSREDFQDGYRGGFKAGYDDGFNGKPVRSDLYGVKGDDYDPDRVPRRDEDADAYAKWAYTDVATDIGYRDGISAGQNDLRNHKEYRPEKHDAYKDADHGFRKDYGDKNLYKEQYRKGFMRGYEDAFHNQGR
jgi:hypothetical protein